MSIMITYSGLEFDPLNPTTDKINIEDIAHSLSMQCRYNGHVKRFYSVAEHCNIVSHNVRPKNALYGLLHDAAKAYTGDSDIENRILCCIFSAFEIDHMSLETLKDVKSIDKRICINEMNQLITGGWRWGGDELAGITQLGISSQRAVKNWYLSLFNILMERR